MATFQLLGFRVDVRASFLMMALVFAGAGGLDSLELVAGWVLVVFVSVLWHELGHAFVARHFGAPARIELHAGGGLTHHGAIDAWWKSFCIAIAGPLAGLALGAVVWGASTTRLHHNPHIAVVLGMALYTNVGWSLLNLVPVLPYDGGLAFRAIVERWTRHGSWIANGVSLAVGSAGLVYALAQRRFWLAYLAGSGAQLSYVELRRLQVRRRLAEAWAAWERGAFDRSEQIARELLARRPDDRVRTAAMEQIAWNMLSRGQVTEARAWLGGLPSGFKASDLMEVTLLLLEGDETAARERTASLHREALGMVSTHLFHAGQFERAARIGRTSFGAHGNANDAYNVACCECRLGRWDEALAWLERAVGAGYDDVEHLAKDDDLAALRELPGYESLVERARVTTKTTAIG